MAKCKPCERAKEIEKCEDCGLPILSGYPKRFEQEPPRRMLPSQEDHFCTGCPKCKKYI